MKEDIRGDQIGRVLQIYSRLLDGYVVNKAEEAHIDGIVIWQDSSGRIYQTQPNTAPKLIFDCLYDYIAR